MSQAAKVPDWLHSFIIDIPVSGTPPHEEPNKMQHIPPKLLENTSEKDYGKYYRPQVVSIGPIHHGKSYVISMEDFKWKAVRELVRELAERAKDGVSIEQVYASVEEKLLRARNCYSCDIIKFFQDDSEWCKMMFLDSCFVVAFICSGEFIDFSCWGSLLNMKNYDSALVRSDLLLYENQLPFEVLDALAQALGFKDTFHGGLTCMFLPISLMYVFSAPTFLDYITSCFDIPSPQWGQFPRELGEGPAPAHILQYYRDLWINFLGKNDDSDCDDCDDCCNAISMLINHWSRLYGVPAPSEPSSVTELKKVGIHCSSAISSLTDIPFKSCVLSGKLFLPQLTFNDSTKAQILNIAAYEFSCSQKYRSSGISSYLSFMGKFIHGKEDVKELRARGILQLNHKDGDDHEVIDFFRYISAHHEPNPKKMRQVKEQISSYRKSKRLLLRVAYAEFKQRYFSGPWNFLVFLAVIFTVSMTIIQTVATCIQIFK